MLYYSSVHRQVLCLTSKTVLSLTQAVTYWLSQRENTCLYWEVRGERNTADRQRGLKCMWENWRWCLMMYEDRFLWCIIKVPAFVFSYSLKGGCKTSKALGFFCELCKVFPCIPEHQLSALEIQLSRQTCWLSTKILLNVANALLKSISILS